MSTWRITREAGSSRFAPARLAVSRGRGLAPESPGTSREISRRTSGRPRAGASESRARVRLHGLVERAPERLDFGLERVDPIQHLLDGLGHGVGQVGVLQIEA